MNNVVAINAVSSERVQELQEQAIKEEMRSFIQNDQEARNMMISRLAQLIDGMSQWDLEYYSGFREATLEVIKSDAVKPLFEKVLIKCLEDEKTPDYRIFEAIGEQIAGQLKLELRK